MNDSITTTITDFLDFFCRFGGVKNLDEKNGKSKHKHRRSQCCRPTQATLRKIFENLTVLTLSDN